MTYGFIIAAGNQNRFEDSIPKALQKINETPLLDINIKNMSKECDKIYVVCSFNNYRYFKKYNNLIVIDSGKGSGDAVLKALERVRFSSLDTCFVQWGDSVQNPLIYKYLKDNYNGTFLVPCKYVENPYVQIVKYYDTLSVYFSKYNEKTSSGWHDLSIFYGNSIELLYYLFRFQKYFKVPDAGYISKHGSEFEFLDVFNQEDMPANILDCSNFKSYSFNTKEEFKELEEIIYNEDKSNKV